MNAFKKYAERISAVENSDKYLDEFQEKFEQYYMGEGDPEEDAAYDAFSEVAIQMEEDGLIKIAEQI